MSKYSFKKRMHSTAYEDYLLDLFTGYHYDRMVPFEDDLVKEAAYGAPLWPRNREVSEDFRPWELLMTAMIGEAVLDYLRTHHYSKYSYPERKREFDYFFGFLKDLEYTEPVYHCLLYLLQTEDVRSLEQDLYSEHRKFMNNLGKEAKRCERGREDKAGAPTGRRDRRMVK